MEKMKSMERLDWLLNNLYDCVEFLTVCWVFLMLTVFPLYAPERYYEIGGYKFSFFTGMSALFLVPGAALGLVCAGGGLGSRLIERRCRKRLETKPWTEQRAGQETKQGRTQETKQRAAQETKEVSEWRGVSRRFSILDAGVVLYLLACIVSYLLSGFKTEAWEGAGGWNMGLNTQLFMITAYFLISRFFPWKRGKARAIVMSGALIGSGLTFLLGILHRFQIDPLGMYEGIDGSYKILFLSTIGQATWYSSYVCTVLPLGLVCFCFGKERKTRILSGIYCVLGFMTLVTQNSDSAFAALGLMFLGLFVIGCMNPKRMERFLEAWILCAASFKAVGFLQWGFADRAMELGGLSMAFSKGAASWVMLLVGAGAYIWLLRVQEKGGKQAEGDAAKRQQNDAGFCWQRIGRKLRAAAIGLTAVGVLSVVCLIVWNTTGLLEEWFGFTSHNSYLLFNDKWGSDRGFTWKTAAEIFMGMPALMKLFGAGPDCFMPYSYSLPEYAQRLNDYWKPNILTNAHNEYLNLLICVGVLGLAAFLFMLGAAVRRFYLIGKVRPFVLVGLLSVCAYAAHNFFCYQQVCCTPFLFLILGLAECVARTCERGNFPE